jgi:hypothetical protein
MSRTAKQRPSGRWYEVVTELTPQIARQVGVPTELKGVVVAGRSFAMQRPVRSAAAM